MLEAFVDRSFPHPEDADRDRVRAQLMSRHARDLEEWNPPPAYRSPASSVVDNVFSQLYRKR